MDVCTVLRFLGQRRRWLSSGYHRLGLLHGAISLPSRILFCLCGLGSLSLYQDGMFRLLFLSPGDLDRERLRDRLEEGLRDLSENRLLLLLLQSSSFVRSKYGLKLPSAGWLTPSPNNWPPSLFGCDTSICPCWNLCRGSECFVDCITTRALSDSYRLSFWLAVSSWLCSVLTSLSTILLSQQSSYEQHGKIRTGFS